MEQFKTKYQNNLREVSGLSVIVWPDDVFLSVDTSAGPCTITLLTIPGSNWDTLYKLYIYDKSSNASVNNITIQTAAGQTINQLSSVLINENGGGIVIRNLGTDSYIGSFSYASGGGGGSDEKVKVSNVDLTTNFLNNKISAGSGISLNILNPGGNEQLEIASTGSGTIIPLSFVNYQALKSANNLVPAQIYLITDAIFTQGGCYVTALTNNSVDSNAVGSFLNVDYQNTLGNFVGVWRTVLGALVAGVSETSWNGKVYQSVTGVNGATNPTLDAVNWILLDRAANPGTYINEMDICGYDDVKNEITFRLDKRNNYIENFIVPKTTSNNLSIDIFQWGNDNVTYNRAFAASILNINYGGVNCKGNFVTSLAILDCREGEADIRFNTLESESLLSCYSTNAVQITANRLTQGGTINALNYITGSVQYNTLDAGYMSITSAQGTMLYNVFQGKNSGFSGSSFNGTMSENTLVGAECNINGTAGQGTIKGNYLLNESEIDARGTLATSIIQFNKLTNFSRIEADDNDNIIDKNVLDAGSVIFIETPLGASSIVRNNLLTNESTITATSNRGLIEDNQLDRNSFITVTANSSTGIVQGNILTNVSSISSPTNSNVIGRYSDYSKGNVLNGATVTCTVNTEAFSGNNLDQAIINITQNSGRFVNNILNQQANLTILINNNTIERTIISAGTINLGTNNTDYIDLVRNNMGSNWPISLDCSDLAVLTAGGVLNISANDQNFGIVTLLNAGGLTINQIQNVNDQFPIKFINDSGSVQITITAIAAVTSVGQIISSGGTTFNLVGRSGAGDDSMYLERNGIYAQVIGTPNILT